MAESGTRRVVGAGEIGRDEVVEAVVGAVGVRAAESAVGDEGVDRAALRRRGRKRRVDLRAVADVARSGARSDRVGHLAQPLEVAREERQRRTLGGEPFGDRLPDSLAAAGDDHMTARESLHSISFVALCVKFRAGSHLRPGGCEHRFLVRRGPSLSVLPPGENLLIRLLERPARSAKQGVS